ncbi:hypothetical protein F0562_029285 [Nyssa sinensis]|uniref:Uncharacterized protein n=1 Tax=Nyssa sinensis TaxID=561372 RepID=A0A5J5B4Q8_9ASTE|nr:hypothetical protein F0562_029285 [Nyssa sinensis]
MELTERTLRRHAVEEIEIRDENVKDEVVEEDEARVSICVPPKNALLANRFRESPVPKDEEEDDEKEEVWPPFMLPLLLSLRLRELERETAAGSRARPGLRIDLEESFIEDEEDETRECRIAKNNI